MALKNGLAFGGDHDQTIESAQGERREMIFAQFSAGRKLHLACEPGEEYRGEVVRAGSLSWPLCGLHSRSNYGNKLLDSTTGQADDCTSGGAQ